MVEWGMKNRVSDSAWTTNRLRTRIVRQGVTLFFTAVCLIWLMNGLGDFRSQGPQEAAVRSEGRDPDGKVLAEEPEEGSGRELFPGRTLSGRRTQPRVLELNEAWSGRFPKVSREELEAYLDAHPDDPRAVLGVAQATDDRDWVAALAARFPKDAALQYVSYRQASEEGKGEALQRLREADPENSEGAYLVAMRAMKAGRYEEAAEVLKSANGLAPSDQYIGPRFEAAREVYQAIGFTAAGSEFLANARTLFPLSGSTEALLALAGGIRKLEKANDAAWVAFRDGNPAGVSDLVQSSFALADRVAGAERRSAFDMMVWATAQTALLNAGVGGTELGNGETKSERLSAAEKWRGWVKSLSEHFMDWPAKATPQELQTYLKSVRAEGEIATISKLWKLPPPE
jgi:tetratricopeptide (TPR) repeat protein